MQKSENKTSEAQLKANQRYKAKKTDNIQANLPKGYKEKLHKIAESQGISVAQCLKNYIDTAYSALFGE